MRNKMVLQPQTTQGMTPSRKTIIIFSTFGTFGVILAGLFILNLSEVPYHDKYGPVLTENPSFEKWRKNRPVGWDNNAGVFIEENFHTEGNLCVGIINESSERKGISQKLSLDPEATYNIYFNLRSNSEATDLVGVEIKYEGEDYRATADVVAGTHFHTKGKEWEKYFGRVTGASSVELFFFTTESAIVYVDMAAVGLNVNPSTPDRSGPLEL